MAYYTVYFPQPGPLPMSRIPGEPKLDSAQTLTLPDGRKLKKGEYKKIRTFVGDPPPSPSGRASVNPTHAKPERIDKTRGFGDDNLKR